MKLIGIMPVRNEDWIVGFSLRAALRWCDVVVVLDHASTDRTEEIIADIDIDHSEQLHVCVEPDLVWEEMRHRQRMLDLARHEGATHIALIDADEILTANLVPSIRLMAEHLGPNHMLELPWLCISQFEQAPKGMPLDHGRSGHFVSGMWATQRVSTVFKDDPRYYWAANNGYDFHHRAPYGTHWHSVPLQRRAGGLMHLQFASRRRLLAKQYLYQLTERLRWPGREPAQIMAAKYCRTVSEAVLAETTPCPLDWWKGYEDLLQYLDVDAEPWQEAECRKILAEHPGIERGLNDFGLFAKL